MDHFEHSIRERAYALWERDGCALGRDEYYWTLAEQELRQAAPAAEPAPVRTPRAKAPAKASSKAAAAAKAAPRRRRTAAEGAAAP
ncbi:DUF2934 domain-containing protein [Methylobacterium nodulans]|uniref:DUF2934 domain-containing protein n=1 Tax=Methylobacterium nodulans (strain LMG 21967 / CNCM I-2342 / ORS 2060) TaxID=460265 RepID=B8IK84_METNO|nr:DUF2934 domain-containing protein [Methylobacterium nodulans]ACL61869.1 conserved hypothetical protein [Methylobacterium nodulans ORS 2060]